MKLIFQILSKSILTISLFSLFIIQMNGQTTLYSEPFGTNDITNDCPSWSTQYSTVGKSDYFEVVSGAMTGMDLDNNTTNGMALWYSEVITTTGNATFDLAGDFYECGFMGPTDYIRAYYKIDGGAETLWFDQTDDNGIDCALQAGSATTIAAGTNVQIIIKMRNTSSRYHKFDNITITGDVSGVLYSETFGTNTLSSDCPSWHGEWWDDEPQYFKVTSGVMEGKNLDYEAIWYSETVDITGYNVNFSADFGYGGSMNGTEYIKAYYKLDGGAETLWFDGTDDTWTAGNKTAVAAGVSCLSGTSLQIVIRVYNTGTTDTYTFDNVLIEGTSTALANFTFASPSISLCNDIAGSTSDYTFTQSTTSDCRSQINTGVTVTVNFPAPTNVSGCTGGTFNGVTIASYTVVTPTQITFTTPTSVGMSETFDIVFYDISNGSITGGNANVSAPNISGGVDAYTTYTFSTSAVGGSTDYTFTSPEVTLSSILGDCVSDYTFTQVFPNSRASINAGETVTVNFIAGTDATTMTAGTFNGTAINMGTVTTTATQVTFTAPAIATTCPTDTFTIILNDITNPTWGSSGNATIGVDNITTGRDTGTYPYAIAFNNADFVDFDRATTPDLATQDALGNCYTGLVAGTHCFRYTQPTSGDAQMVVITDCAGMGGGSSSAYTSDVTSGCASIGGNWSPQMYEGCTYNSASAVKIGGCLTPGEIYTACVTVTPACAAAGASFCPLLDCSVGVCGSASLPIELLYFNAIMDGKVVKLNWTTTAEINNDYFTIQRTQDGFIYTEIGTIAGAGNSNTILNYREVDQYPLSGISYYRLKQTDFDGNYTYSKLVAVELAPKGSLFIDYVYLDHDNNNLEYYFSYNHNKPLSVDILDVSGKVIYSETISTNNSNNVKAISLSNISQGVYLLRLSDGVNSKVKKFIY
ncbi:MAG: T9SS type A sorting domain-containing protein [Vicingus serpentipes]|nr:T9SS type A sorting domain-containing protein [Vicingus serpentipes]